MGREQNGSARKRAKCNTSADTIPAPNETMAQIVGMAPAKTPTRIIRAITYSCPCGGGCRACGEDSGTRVADVDDWSVCIAGISYDRGIESDERIAAALESVDEHCRDDLEWLLRHGPSDDVDSPAMQAVIAQAEGETRPPIEPMFIVDVLRMAVAVAIRESAAPFRDRMLALADLKLGMIEGGER